VYKSRRFGRVVVGTGSDVEVVLGTVVELVVAAARGADPTPQLVSNPPASAEAKTAASTRRVI
jgi:hypothetical protein